MARKKKPTNETNSETTTRELLETIANKPDRSEKVSWNRKMDNLIALIARLTPIEDKIRDIIVQEKLPLMDEVEELRSVMINECIHPYEQLVKKEDCVECKFCNRRMSVSQRM